MKCSHPGFAFFVAVQALPLDDIRRLSPVLGAWLAECGDVIWHDIRADRDTLEIAQDEVDGLVRVQGDLHVVVHDGASFAIRVEAGGLQSGTVHRLAVHAPSRTLPPSFPQPITDEIRAMLVDPCDHTVAAAFDQRAHLLSDMASVAEGIEPLHVLTSMTSDLALHVFGSSTPQSTYHLSVDRATMERRVWAQRTDFDALHWHVPARLTVTGQNSADPRPAEIDVVVAFDCDGARPTLWNIDLPAVTPPGSYVRV